MGVGAHSIPLHENDQRGGVSGVRKWDVVGGGSMYRAVSKRRREVDGTDRLASWRREERVGWGVRARPGRRDWWTRE